MWVDGRWLGRHEGGHTPITLDLTSCLPAEKLAIRVRAEDDPHGLHHPRGKQTRAAGSHDIWYTRTTGIWQQPWFEVVPDLYITSLLWSSDLERSQLVLYAELSRKPDDGSLLEARLALGDQIIIRASVDVAADAATLVRALPPHGIGREPLLWSPEHPTLLMRPSRSGIPERPDRPGRELCGLREVG